MPDIVRYAGFANDPTPEGAAPAAKFHVDIASATLDAPSETEMIAPSGIGREARAHRPGFYSVGGNVVYAFDIRSIAEMLRWGLGGYEYTATAPVNAALHLHEIYGQQGIILPGFIARIGKDVFEHIFRGCVVNSIELTAEGEFAMCTADIIGLKDAKGTLLAIDALVIPDEYPLAFHEVTVTRNSVDYSAKVKSMSLTIANNGNVENGRSLGSRFARRMTVLERDVRLGLNLYFDSTAELEAFWGGSTGPTATGVTELPWELHFNAGADGVMDILLPRLTHLTVPTQPSGREEITQNVSFKAFQDVITLNDGATDVASSILVSVENAATDMAV